MSRRLDWEFNNDCCGIGEITGLDGRRSGWDRGGRVTSVRAEDLKELVNGIGKRPDGWGNSYYDYEPLETGAAYIISDVAKRGTAQKMVSMIKKYKLGSVVGLPTYKNSNSGNRLKVYIWHYNGKKMK